MSRRAGQSAQPPMRSLREALAGFADVPAGLTASDLTLDSRQVRPGAAFFACHGRREHGLRFAEAAVARGARAVFWEPAPGIEPAGLGGTPSWPVPRLGERLGLIADRFYGAPSAALQVVGITGTNGKTSCAWLLAQALERCGRRAAYLGTLGAGPPGLLEPAQLTTPDALSLQRTLAALREQHIECVAMEVSSVALDQHRCAGLRFHTAVFTNLSRDHLDYHGSMAAYAAAKERLFAWPTLALRVINADDAFGLALARMRLPGTQLLLTSRTRRAAFPEGALHVCASSSQCGADGVRLELDTWLGRGRLESPLLGELNVENLLLVLAVLLGWQLPLAQALSCLAGCGAPPGRMQPEGGGPEQPLVLIDYAHTPEALEQALRSARGLTRGRLFCVFGCGGGRDTGKRAPMGRAAAQLADQLILTDDNPRGESPEAIVADILEGVRDVANASAQVIHDRGQAIEQALATAHPGDIVLLAGRGHEDYQIVGDERRPFNDAAVVRRLLTARSAA